MKPSREVEQLATEIGFRHDTQTRSPYILFLGRRCARAAHVPSEAEMARSVLPALIDSDPDLASRVVPRGLPSDDMGYRDAFYELLANMDPVQRYSLLQSFYASIAVPAFYQDVARLLKAGYFSHVLTTNVDTLLEQALEGLGLWRHTDYFVLMPGVDTAVDGPPTPHDEQQILIVKLHGDVGQGQAAITPDEIEATLRPQRRFVKGELTGDLIMVGYEFESDPIHRWLQSTPGELWWVNNEPPEPGWVGRFDSGVRFINGPAAEPETFFAELAVRLLVLPVRAALRRPVADSEPASTIPHLDLSDSELERDYIREEIKRRQGSLAMLQQRAALGENNVQLQNQIKYERARLAELEDQFRQVSETKPHVLTLLDDISRSAQEAVIGSGRDTQSAVDPRTLSFLQDQIQTLRAEFTLDEPNQHVLSAVMSATLSLVERLGPSVVDPGLAHELASFLPTRVQR